MREGREAQPGNTAWLGFDGSIKGLSGSGACRR
jgi:hypothetical protein